MEAVRRLYVVTHRDPAVAGESVSALVATAARLGIELVTSQVEAEKHADLGNVCSLAEASEGCGAAIVLVAFCFWEWHNRHPMLDLRLFQNPRFAVSSGGITLVFFAMFGTFFLLAQYLQGVLEYSPLGAAVRLLPISFVMMAVAPNTPKLVARFGADKIEGRLPKLMRATKRSGRKIAWAIDPMHGNTLKAANGYKTRPFDRILQEVKTFFAVHEAEGTHGGGVHLEMTGKDVTECTGGARAISDQDLNDRYHTLCDPRLNAEQSIDLAFLVADLVKKERAGTARPLAAVAGL